MSRTNSITKTTASAKKGTVFPAEVPPLSCAKKNASMGYRSMHPESLENSDVRVTRSQQRAIAKKTQSSSLLHSKNQSSDTSSISLRSAGTISSNDRKRSATGAIVVTDEKAKLLSTKRSRSSNCSTHYSLRSKDSSLNKENRLLSVSRTGNIDVTRLSVTVTPAEVCTPATLRESRKRLPFTDCMSKRSSLPSDVVDIFSKPSEYGQSRFCRCPSSDCPINSYNRNAIELSSSYLEHYGLELDGLLRKQESKEVLDFVGPMKAKRQSLSSSSSNTQMAMDDVSVDDNEILDCSSDDGDEELAGDEDSSLGTPRPGTVLKYSLRGMSKSSPYLPEEQDNPFPRQPFISPKMRNILVNWLGEAALEYKVSDESFHLSVSILDAVMSKGPASHSIACSDSDSEYCDSDKENEEDPHYLIPRSDFQALGCACLWIASKIDDRNPPGQDDFVYISDYSFKAEKLLALEAKVCKVLGFRLQRVTPLHFLPVFMKASQACLAAFHCKHENGVLRLTCMYLAELSRLSVELIGVKPSLIAAAIVYLARVTIGIIEKDICHRVDEKGYWTKTLVHYTGYNVNQLAETVLKIHENQLEAEKVEYLNAPFTKYKRSSCRYVSLKTVPRRTDLGFKVLDFSNI